MISCRRLELVPYAWKPLAEASLCWPFGALGGDPDQQDKGDEDTYRYEMK